MSTSNEKQASGRPSNAWIVSCAALCMAIIAYGYLGNKNVSGDMAYQVGYNLPISIFAAGIFHLVFRKRESTRTSWLGFFFIYGAFIASSYLATVRQQAEFKVATVEIGHAMQAAAQAGTESATDISVVPAASGDAGKMERVTKQLINRSLAQRRAYEAELEAIGWSNILDGQRIKGDENLSGSMKMLHSAHIIVAKYRSKTDEIISQNRRDIESSDMEPGMKRDMLSGFENSSPQGKERALKIWALEEQIIDQVDRIFNLLSETRSEWEVTNGQITFHRQDELDAYNSYLSRINEIVMEQQKIQNSGLQQAQETLSGMSH